MKKLKNRITLTALLTLLIIPFFPSCEEEAIPPSNEKEITSVEIVAGTQLFVAQLYDGTTWNFAVNSDFNQNLLKTARVDYTVVRGTYASYPLTGSTHDFTVSPMGIVVTAEDGSEVYYSVEMKVQ